MFTLEVTQDEIFDLIQSAVPQRLVEQTIPDVETLERTENGDVVPYYAIQFGDISPGRVRNMATVMGDDYRLPLYIQSVGTTPKIARRLNNQIIEVFLGQTFQYAGNVRKRPGLGGVFPIRNTSGSVEAYIAPAGFDLLVQLEIATP